MAPLKEDLPTGDGAEPLESFEAFVSNPRRQIAARDVTELSDRQLDLVRYMAFGPKNQIEVEGKTFEAGKPMPLGAAARLAGVHLRRARALEAESQVFRRALHKARQAHRYGEPTPEPSAPSVKVDKVYGLTHTYAGLRKLVAARRKELGLSQIAFDEICGFPGGYQGKLEANVRRYGDMSLDVTLAALGLAIALVPSAGRDSEKESQVKDLNESRTSRMRKLGRAGGRAARASMTDAEWSEHCRKANKVRWRKWREARGEKARRERKRDRPDRAASSIPNPKDLPQ
ncbi:MAG TPA: hypothetical protein VKV77_11170 [Methylovirgula sp.]|nr:hypothetical protein [Methylovirgula sp.]